MKVPQSGLRLDNPSWPLLQALTSYWGITTANGAAAGTSLIDALCSTAGLQPGYVNHKVRIHSGPSAGQERVVAVHTLATGTLDVIDPFTDSAGAVQQILAGTLFCIVGLGGGGISPFGPVIGFGTLDTDSTTVPADSTRAGLYAWENNDYFKGCILMPIAGDCRYQPRPISAHVSATGVFTLDEPFSQLPGLVRYVLIRSDYPYQRLIDIFNLVNAILTTTETGGTVTTTGPGTEDNVYINNAPAGVYEPLIVKIDFTGQTVAETVTVRTYYRYNAGGGWILEDTNTFAGVQAEPSKRIPLDPCRFGIRVTMERIAGAAQNYDWYVVYRG